MARKGNWKVISLKLPEKVVKSSELAELVVIGRTAFQKRVFLLY